VNGELVRTLTPNEATSAGLVAFQDVADMLDKPMTIEVEHGHLGDTNVRVEVLLGPDKFEIGTLTAREAAGHPWRTDQFVWQRPSPDALEATQSALAAGESADDDKAGLRSADNWTTESGAFLALSTCDVATQDTKSIFAGGEDIAFAITFRLTKKVAEFWFVIVIYTSKGERVALEATHFPKGADAGNHNMRIVIKNPNLRQGDYNASLEILPSFTMNWGGGTRLPFICHCDRAVFFKINEDYTGTIDLGLTRQDIAMELLTTTSMLSNGGRA
jgi:hypothetical protein